MNNKFIDKEVCLSEINTNLGKPTDTANTDSTSTTATLFDNIKGILQQLAAFLLKFTNIEDNTDSIVNSVTIPSAFNNGSKAITTATTPEQITATSTILLSGITVKAYISNTGVIYIGNSSDNAKVAHGYRLNAGEEKFIAVDNLNKIWLDTSVSGSGYSYIAS